MSVPSLTWAGACSVSSIWKPGAGASSVITTALPGGMEGINNDTASPRNRPRLGPLHVLGLGGTSVELKAGGGGLLRLLYAHGHLAVIEVLCFVCRGSFGGHDSPRRIATKSAKQTLPGVHTHVLALTRPSEAQKRPGIVRNQAETGY
jgi:hypothetical protein